MKWELSLFQCQVSCVITVTRWCWEVSLVTMVSVPRVGGEHALKLLFLLLCGKPTQNPQDSRYFFYASCSFTILVKLLRFSLIACFVFTLTFFFFLLFISGTDIAAADAGQIPDHVRPDHWAEYPFAYSNCWPNCSWIEWNTVAMCTQWKPDSCFLAW